VWRKEDGETGFSMMSESCPGGVGCGMVDVIRVCEVGEKEKLETRKHGGTSDC
jgi:hypothetical protein